MKSWRKAQPKMPRPPKQKITASQIEITDVPSDAPPLAKHDSQYREIHERLLASEPGARFRVTLASEYLASCARASVLGFARRNGVAIGTLLVGSQIEVKRLQESAE
jgi:hypothetical protein